MIENAEVVVAPLIEGTERRNALPKGADANWVVIPLRHRPVIAMTLSGHVTMIYASKDIRICLQAKL
ncbi:hypothetical protein ANCCAN_24900 [Ancylostoma caninum]|uniref:Uncharacterized protein n=1 Tax=Ancylostoma caninum TaxID=29170 RepID=A0A368FBA4_ANCCA|nr:hypothetical protein ANCCAN_24900 [Ancylostoma caninum]